jgi:hypothetical protein
MRDAAEAKAGRMNTLDVGAQRVVAPDSALSG